MIRPRCPPDKIRRTCQRMPKWSGLQVWKIPRTYVKIPCYHYVSQAPVMMTLLVGDLRNINISQAPVMMTLLVSDLRNIINISQTFDVSRMYRN